MAEIYDYAGLILHERFIFLFNLRHNPSSSWDFVGSSVWGDWFSSTPLICDAVLRIFF